MKRMLVHFKPFLGIFIFGILIKALGAISDILIPSFMGKVIDEGIETQNIRQIIFLCAMMLLFAGLTLGFNLWANYLSSKATQSMGESLRDHLYGHIQKLTVQDVDDISAASLITRTTNDVERIQNTMLMMTRVAVRAPIMAVGGITLSLLIDPVLTAVIFCGMVVVCFVSFTVFNRAGPIFRRVQKNLDKLTLILRENLAGIRVIKSFNKGAYESERFDKQSRAVRDNEMKAGKIHTVSGPAISLINGLTVAAVLFVSMYRLRDGHISIGQVVTIISYVNQILMAMANIPRIFLLFSRASTSAARVNEILDIKPDNFYGTCEEGADTQEVLTLRDVSFRYGEAGENALMHISFSVKRGETVGVIGGTGSGKSTLLYLILRLYRPDQGEILLNGRPIEEYSQNYLHSQVTAALQQYNIFGMTIGENIALNLEREERALRHAAETAQLGNVISGVENGFDYEISQAGSNLSGGQKQRVNIARALYRNTPLIILDDVSSALDYQTDRQLRNALKKEEQGKSVLLISQRVSSIREADRILVLDGGRMAGFGTHESLLNTCDVYRALCRTQGVIADEEEELIANA